MDDKWFKQRKKIVGVNDADIAARLGRDRSVISKIVNGQQRLTLEWAEAFADVLQVPLAEVLAQGGIASADTVAQLAPGFSDADAVPFSPAPAQASDAETVIRAFGGGRPGIDAWQVKSTSMALAGILAGDVVLVDTHQSERTRTGDIVLAQHYDWQLGTAVTVIRRHEPPVLVAAGTNPDDQRVLVVDGKNVVIKGKITALWRR